MRERGYFITFEGIDGAGKSTQLRILAELLVAHGHAVTTTREPGATPFGEKVRDLLLATEIALTPDAELLLFLADRIEHVSRVIKPALAAGNVVLCDRFSDSTIAYQGYGRGADVARVTRWDAETRGDIQPDLTLLLDCPVAEGARRRSRASDRYQSLDPAFHERVREGFLTLAAAAPQRIRRIDTMRPVAEVSAEVARITLARLGAQSAGAPRRQVDT